MSYAYDISIVIVNYNVRYFIAECLESFYRSNLDGLNVEVFIVDNDSIDGSVQMIQNTYPEVKLIANKKNVGFSTANNQAIKEAQGKYILLLNPDTVLEENTLRICFDHAEANPNVGAIGVKMIDGAGTFLPESKRALPTPWNSLTKLTGLAGIFPKSKRFNGYALGHLSEHENHSVQVLCGAFMFMPHKTIDTVGMLDERFFMYAEDIDLSYRIIKAGYEIHYLADTTIIHYKGESTKKGSLNYVKTFYNAMSLYVEKHYTGVGASLFGKFLMLGIWLRASVSAVHRVVNTLFPMLLDGGFIGVGLYQFSKFWASTYFQTSNYYDKSPLIWSIASYVFVWIGLAWLLGYYKKNTWQKRLQVIGIGLIIILAVYGLLPEAYRTSRVLIVGGAAISGIVKSTTSLLRKKLKKTEKQRKVLIVAHQESADKIKENLLSIKLPIELLGAVFPEDKNYDADVYLNNISELDRLTKVLKADEVIFSTESLSTKEIMQYMIRLDSKLSFKIMGDESLSILGSKSSNTSGEIYNVDIQYNLNVAYYKHIKRVLDVFVALACIILFPIVLVLYKFKIRSLFEDSWNVLLGKCTWVGYNTQYGEYKNLPHLPRAIFPISNDEEHASEANRNYAKTYTVWMDFVKISQGISNM